MIWNNSIYTSCSPQQKNKSPPPSREQRIEESKTLDHFLQFLRQKLENSEALQKILAGQSSTDYNSNDYRMEREKLMQINNVGLREGLLAGVVTFATLRFAPRIIARRLISRQQQMSQQPYVFDPKPSPPTPSLSSSFTLLSLKFARLLLDSAASLVVAAYTSFYFTDEQVLLKTVSELPLVEGRSVVADEFCQDIVKEYRNIHDDAFWNKVHSPYLQALSVFVRNCQLRAAQEAKLRKELGLNNENNEPVSIPPPGVFRMEELNDESFSDASLFGVDGDMLQNDDEDAWAKALTAAKGEENDQKK